jgi:serine/threonine protein kinase
MFPERLGPYRIVRKLGEGGMGVVYEANDERLGRQVAIKAIREDRREQASDQERRRLWEEARIAARVNHPNLCQLHDILEEDGHLFLVLELLQGRSLSDELKRGSIAPAEGVSIVRGILAALMELHRIGIVHRDLKPSNVFISPHGVKLLDFGLARQAWRDEATEATASLQSIHSDTAGTPYYMAPEQIAGDPPSIQSDIFAAGCILYEVLTGKRAFEGMALGQVLYAVLTTSPPALTGEPLLERADAIVRRALEKKPENRFSSAAEMLETLEGIEQGSATFAPAPQKLQRLIVLPFRMLRPDPETEFLVYSLPDAITCSLTGLGSIVVRSTIAGAHYDSSALDLKRIAAECNVDAILTGNLLRAGDAIRVTAQLIETQGGTVLWSQVTETQLSDIFQLQDQMVNRIVGSLMVPLSARDQRILRHDVPTNAFAYECYLRGNQLLDQGSMAKLDVAKELYLRCLNVDANYAPAWARLGRLYRIIGKFYFRDEEALRLAEEAFQRAFSLNPDLAIAHHYYTGLETDCGRSLQAVERLLALAHSMPNDANLFAGLGQACRYCGLLDASLLAFERAKQIDPNVPTSSAWTLFALSRFQDAHDASEDPYIKHVALAEMGRGEETIDELREMAARFPPHSLMSLHLISLVRRIEGDRDGSVCAAAELASQVKDPESLFQCARFFAALGEFERAMQVLPRVIESGYACPQQLRDQKVFAGLRGHPAFTRLIQLAESHRQASRRKFLEAGGDRVLGMALVE